MRVHPRDNIETIKKSLREFGQTVPILLDADGQVIKGNGTLQSVLELKWPTISVIRSSLQGKTAEAYAIVDNKSTDQSHFDETLLAEVIKDLEGEGIDLELTGFKPYELAPLLSNEEDPVSVKLAEVFLVPPFSVLDARQGYWQERKKAWLSLGIESELGRHTQNEGNAYALTARNQDTMSDSTRKIQNVARKNLTWVKRPNDATLDRTSQKILASGTKVFNTEGNLSEASGTSIFDPVLCELMYRWFTKKNDMILDPFAGGSVRGIVAGKLERLYTGMDLSKKQIEANQKQAATILGKEPNYNPRWLVGDSLTINEHVTRPVDSIFTCPPYGDLEVYSDDTRDISNMEFEKFINIFNAIVMKATRLLKPDRFAGVVVGDYRDEKGMYRNFPALTIDAFQAAGLTLYNEAILVTMVGSLPLRVKNQFQSSRKLGKTHQNFYVFVKGDPRKATERLGQVEIGEISNE